MDQLPDDSGEPPTGNRRVAITVQEATLLALLVIDRQVLEIGTGLGVSTKMLASTALEVVTVDVDPWVHDVVWPDLPANVRTVTSVDDTERFDVVFISDCSAGELRADLAVACRCCRGLIVVHDAHSENVGAAISADGGDWYVVPTEHGVALSVNA